MPIYETKDYEKVISRIRVKVRQKNILLGQCLTEEEIIAFENKCKVRLPQSYRLFLMHVGNGCHSMLEECPLKSLDDIKPKDLSQPFMLEEAWIGEADDRELSVVRREIVNNIYQGEIELINLGCGMSYNLIVTGNSRGEMWNFTDVGVQPCCERQDFLGWFELWLDFQDETDYFRDYV